MKRLAIAGLALVLAIAGLLPAPAQARAATVTNLAHLDFLLDGVSPAPVTGHSTYRLAQEPELVMPWTYADRRADGTYARIGGGTLDPATGHYTQGAYNTDDIARAAVVYLRHWRQTGEQESRRKAYELLRSVAFLQTTTGANRGRSVLWIQADGELNPSAEPVELPDPSDSGPSYWQARTVWAFGEGYAAFRRADPAFAAFLQQRLRLAVGALERDVLDDYGRFRVADGIRVPAWLITNGTDATSEAVLGLAAYVQSSRDRQAERALGRFADGIAAMAAGERRTWPYGAVLPWAESRSVWHAWGSQLSAALARSSAALDRPRLLRPAIKELVGFDTTLLTAGGPDNGWLPTPSEQVQIAYGADSRVQSLLATAEVGRRPVGYDLAAMNAAWFFGANRSGAPAYDPATGVTFDGVEADGRVNRNSGAESTIHGLLTMLALDAHPRVRERAQQIARVQSRRGLSVVEAENATTTGEVVTPADGWTGESRWSAGSYLELARGEAATLALPAGTRVVEPVSWQEERGTARSIWTQGGRTLGTLRHRVGAQGITAVPGALLPQSLGVVRDGDLDVRVARGAVKLDAVIARPAVSSLVLTGSGGRSELHHSNVGRTEIVRVGASGLRSTIEVYDQQARLVATRSATGVASIAVPAGGLVVVG